MNLPIFKNLNKLTKRMLIAAIVLTGIFAAHYFEILEYVIYTSGFVMIMIGFVLCFILLIKGYRSKIKFSQKILLFIIGFLYMLLFLSYSIDLFWPFILKFFNR